MYKRSHEVSHAGRVLARLRFTHFCIATHGQSVNVRDMSNSTHIATVAGIPIKVHISLWIVLPLLAFLGPYREQPLWGLLYAACLFISVALHELGHSLVAINKGGHVKEILLLPIGGIAKLDRMPSAPKDEILIAAAGPAVSLLLALILGFAGMLMMLAFGPTALRMPPVTLAINLAITNLILALFNLVPSFPMDGGRIFRAWMTPRVGKLEATRRAAKVGRILAVAFGLVGLVSFNMFLVAIAIFIYFSATAEYRVVQFQELFMKDVYSPSGTESRTEQTTYTAPSPPSGIASSKSAKRVKNVFDDLYSKWQ